ncbi:Uncharacterised protein [Mycobacteroides abscessus subsp. abscessus]|nr:Uncharacterised protein [Mycobacteroides abscessus subsp. abscessus]
MPPNSTGEACPVIFRTNLSPRDANRRCTTSRRANTANASPAVKSSIDSAQKASTAAPNTSTELTYLGPAWYGKSEPKISRSAPNEATAARSAGVWSCPTVSYQSRRAASFGASGHCVASHSVTCRCARSNTIGSAPPR